MKKITIKLLFDLIMALLWIVLMIYSLTGAYWHEVLGLVMLGLFGIHIAYNIPKMKKEIPRMLHSGKNNVTLRYCLDLVLLLFGAFTGVSGVLISKEILTGIEAANIPLWNLAIIGCPDYSSQSVRFLEQSYLYCMQSELPSFRASMWSGFGANSNCRGRV